MTTAGPTIARHDTQRAFGLAELLFALFLNAGAFKADPRLSWVLPYDLTVVAAILACAAILSKWIRLRAPIPTTVWWMVMLFAMFIPALGLTEPTAYGIEKAQRFFTLTLFAALGPFFLIDSVAALRRLINALSLIGLIVALDGAYHLITQGGLLRLTGFSTTTITFGRIVALPFFWLLALSLSRQVVAGAAWIVGSMLAILLVASGSKAPVADTVLAIAALFLWPGQDRRLKRVLIASLCLAGFLIAWYGADLMPTGSRLRLENSFQGDFGASGSVRLDLAKESWSYIRESPFGIGFGGLAARSFGSAEGTDRRERRFSHNILMESALEGGWATGFYFALVLYICIMSAGRQRMLVPNSPELCFLFLYLVFQSLGDIVSGELNDSKMLFTLMSIALLSRTWYKPQLSRLQPRPQTACAEAIHADGCTCPR